MHSRVARCLSLLEPHHRRPSVHWYFEVARFTIYVCSFWCSRFASGAAVETSIMFFGAAASAGSLLEVKRARYTAARIVNSSRACCNHSHSRLIRDQTARMVRWYVRANRVILDIVHCAGKVSSSSCLGMLLCCEHWMQIDVGDRLRDVHTSAFPVLSLLPEPPKEEVVRGAYSIIFILVVLCCCFDVGFPSERFHIGRAAQASLASIELSHT
jgi:hypothetical protein